MIRSSSQERGAAAGRLPLPVYALGLGAFAAVTAEFLPVAVLPEVAQAFGVSPGYAGLTVTMPGLLAAAAAPGVMLLAGKVDRRTILLSLSALLLAACLMSALARTFWLLLVGRALVGVSLGAFWSVGLAVAVRLVRPEHGHRAAGAVFAGVTAAMIFGVPTGSLIAEHFSWRGAFVAGAVMAGAALLMQILTLPRMAADGVVRLAAMVAFVGRPEAQASLAMTGLVFAAHFGTYTYLAPLLDASGMAPSTVTAVLLGYGVAGFLSNYWASITVGRHLGRTLAAALLTLCVTLVALPVVAGDPAWRIAAVLLWGVAYGAVPLGLNSWHRHHTGSTDIASALFTFTAQVAIAAGSSAGGLVVDRLGLTADYWCGAFLVVIGLAFLVRPSAARRVPA